MEVKFTDRPPPLGEKEADKETMSKFWENDLDSESDNDVSSSSSSSSLCSSSWSNLDDDVESNFLCSNIIHPNVSKSDESTGDNSYHFLEGQAGPK